MSNLSLQRLGGTSIAACLCYVDAGVVFIGSRYGDAQLVRLLEQPNDHDSFIEEIDSFTNIGPMADVVVIDLDRQGQVPTNALLKKKNDTLALLMFGVTSATGTNDYM